MVTRVDHIQLVVKDLEATVSFFRKLGFQEIRRTPNHGITVELKLPGPDPLFWEIHQIGEGEVIGVEHIAFAVDDFQREHQELAAKGVGFREAPRFVKGRTIVSLSDPDGLHYLLVDTHKGAGR